MRNKAGTLVAVLAMTMVGTATAAPNGKPPKQLPFVGYVKGFVTPQFAPGFPLVRDTFGGRCSVPSDWIASWSGVGVSTHTGVIHASGSDCDRIDLATGNLEYGDGVISEYGANGDYLYGTYTNGHGTLGGLISDDWTIVGGTGRFAHATGHGVESFILLVPSSSITFTSTPLPFINPWVGSLAY